MPQASDGDRAFACKMWRTIDMDGPCDFLKGHGFFLGGDLCWRKPRHRWRDLTRKEKFAIRFLIDEWDFGSFVDDHSMEKRRA